MMHQIIINKYNSRVTQDKYWFILVMLIIIIIYDGFSFIYGTSAWCVAYTGQWSNC